MEESLALGRAFKAATQTQQEHPEVEGSLEPDQLRVLVVDDSPEIRRLVQLQLWSLDIEVESAQDGVEAEKMALSRLEQGRPYNLILMDMGMPQQDGYQTTQKLRAQSYTAPIVALTAHSLGAERERCIESGCNDYVTKPFSFADISGLVRQLKDSEAD